MLAKTFTICNNFTKEPCQENVSGLVAPRNPQEHTMNLTKSLRNFSLCLLLLMSAALARPLQIWIMPNGANPQGIMEERLQAFKRETGMDAKVVVLDWGEAWSRIHTALETGEGPDVLQLGTTWVSYFAHKGWLAPLDAHANTIRPERFLATSWKTTRVDGDDSFYGIPWFVDVRVLLGNRRVLAENNINASDISNHEGFHKALRKLKDANLRRADANIIHPFGFPGKSDWNIPHNFAPWIWSEGGEFLRKVDGQWRSTLLEPGSIRGIRRYLSFVLDSLVNPQSLRENTAQVTQRFNSGEQVFILNTSELIMQTRIPTSEGGLENSPIGLDGLVAFPVPAGPGGSVSFVGGSNLCLPRNRANNAGALRLLLFLTRADNLNAYNTRVGFLPPDANVLEEWSKDTIYSTLVTQASKGRAYPNIPNWGQIESMLVEMFSAVWTMVDVGGLYDDAELYRILVEHHNKIDKVLGAPASMVLSEEEFLKILAPFRAVQETPIDTAAQRLPETGWTLAQKMGSVVAILVILIILFISLRPKKKK